MLSYLETHETHYKKAYLYIEELENIYIIYIAAYCPFKVLKPLWSGKACLCSIEIDGARRFCGRSLCKLESGRSAGVLDLRNKKPIALGSDRNWWIGRCTRIRWDGDRVQFGLNGDF